MPRTAIPSATAAAIADATADRVNPGWRHGRPPQARLSSYELAVNHIRANRPMTAWKLAKELEWPVVRAKHSIRRARELGLIAKVGMKGQGRYVYGAVQVPGWPNPAPDTEPRR